MPPSSTVKAPTKVRGKVANSCDPATKSSVAITDAKLNNDKLFANPAELNPTDPPGLAVLTLTSPPTKSPVEEKPPEKLIELALIAPKYWPLSGEELASTTESSTFKTTVKDSSNPTSVESVMLLPTPVIV